MDKTSHVDNAICKNCESLFKDGSVYRCKLRTEGDLLNKTNAVVGLQDHCSCFSEDKNKKTVPIKSKPKKKRIQNILIENYIDNVESFYEKQPFFFDKSNIFWFWRENKYIQVDDTDVMNMLDDSLGFMGLTVNSKLKSSYLEAFKRVGRKHTPKEAPTKWVQFKDKAYSISSLKTYSITPDYFFTNPIPWEISASDSTPTLDRLFVDWVGEKYVQTLYELLAYCCYTNYPIQLLFCLVGSGRNGKGCFLKVLDKFLGDDNVTSTSLDLISGTNKSRFESFRLYKKLVALMGETNFGLLTNTSLLKQLTGGDKIGFEKKGKDPFTDYNYAKIIIASNSLPTSQDTSDGFYRRWLIIDFPNEFPEGKDITRSIPEKEYSNLATKVIKILPKLISRGKFHNQGEISDRRLKYIYASNPLPLFLNLCCDSTDSQSQFVSSAELYTAYVYYLKKHKKRKVKVKEFRSALEDEGYWTEKTTKSIGVDKNGYPLHKSTYWIEGISLIPEWKKQIDESVGLICLKGPISHFNSLYRNKVGEGSYQGKKASFPQENRLQVEELIEKHHIKCAICGANPTYFYAFNRYFCSEKCVKKHPQNLT